MNAAGEDAQDERVAGGDVDEHVVRQNGRVEEDEEAVFGGFDGRDVAAEALQRRAESRFSASPKSHQIAYSCESLRACFRSLSGFHVIRHMLIDGGKSCRAPPRRTARTGQSP